MQDGVMLGVESRWKQHVEGSRDAPFAMLSGCLLSIKSYKIQISIY